MPARAPGDAMSVPRSRGESKPDASRKGWAQVPHDLLTDNRLSPTARVMFGLLVKYRNDEPDNPRFGWAWPKVESLAADLEVSERTIRRALGELVGAGWVEREKLADLDGAGEAWSNRNAYRPRLESAPAGPASTGRK